MTRLIPTSLLLMAVSLLATQAVAQTPQIQAYTAYKVIPEGLSAIISFEPTTITADDSVTLDLSKTGDDESRASLSDNSITLTPGAPTPQVMVTVANNADRQDSAITFTVGFTLNKGTLDGQTPGPPQALTFTIPPNDLEVAYKKEPPETITGASTELELVIEGLASTKSFVVSSVNPDIVVTSPEGIVSVVDGMLSITLEHKDSEATQFTLPTLKIIHLDALQGPPQSAIAAGSFHSCALKSNGEAECWGSDFNGKSTEPTPNGPYLAIAVGDQHSCALKTNGDAECWGLKEDGRSPALTNGPFVAIAAGRVHTCALKTNGDAQCWGNDVDDQAPALTKGPFVAISAGSTHTCAIKTNGDAQCWGNNDDGQAPALAKGPFVTISVGDSHNCALRTNGKVECWGTTDGSGRTTEPNPNGPYLAISAGDAHNCAIKTNGDAECWGNDGNNRTTVPDGFTARTKPDVVWLGEKTQFIGGIPIKVKVYLEGALP